MAFKVVNNEVISNNEEGFVKSLSIDGTLVLERETGNIVLKNVEIDGTTVSVSSGILLGLTTDDIAEGSNLYYTDARAQAVSINSLSEDTSPSLSANLDAGNFLINNLLTPVLSTDAATKGYVDSTVSSGITSLTTDDVPEGILNQYYLDSRARSAISVTGSGTYDSLTGVIDIQGGVTSVNTQTGDVVLTTTEITEGTNLYYTDSRVDANFATKSTSNLAEGSNLYYTDSRVDANFATKTTTDLAEGTNLYYTDSRVDANFATKTTTDLAEGTNLYYTDSRFDSRLALKSTTDLAEGANLYFTTARANLAIDTRVTKTFVDALGIQASSVDANSVALGTDTTGNYVATVTGTGGEIVVTGSGAESANITLSFPTNMTVPQDLTVTGNLTVNGTTITNDTTTVAVNDPYITVGGMTPLQSDDNKDRGVRFRWHDGGADTTAGSFIVGHTYIITSSGTTDFTLIGAADSNPGTVFVATGAGSGTGTANDEINTNLGFFGFDDSDQSFFFIPEATESGETFSGTLGNAKFGTVTANLIGDVTGDTSGTHTGPVVGNSSTATALQTARTFSLSGDVVTSLPATFDGTGDVVLNTIIQPNSVALGTDTSGNYVASIAAGTGILVSGSGVETAAVTITHADTSSQTSVNNSNGVVIQDITLDDFGHITSIGSLDLDGRYYTETESDARFVNTSGDTLTGYLTLNADPLNALHAATKQYVDAQVVSGVVASADKWTTARTITLAGDATGNVSIDGSANVTLTVAVVDDSHNHIISNVDGLQTALDSKLGVSANAVSASKWATARTITLAGDATGSVSVDGSADATLTVTVADDSHNHIISNVDGLQTALDAKLASSSYTAADVLSKLLTVDGAGSGLDADLLDGISSASFLRSDTDDTMTAILSFGSQTRQMINLWSTNYGIGVQSSTTYFRSDSRFSWHRGGSHSDTENDPGTGGTLAMTLDGSSNLVVTGDVTAYSDVTLKENIEVIADPLTKILNIRGVTYTRNDLEDTETRHMGVIAQEVEQYFPEVVHTTVEGIKTVNYGALAGAFIEAFKAQQQQIESLSREIENLKK